MIQKKDKENIERILKEKKTYVKMLEKTLEEAREHNGNTSVILAEITETERFIMKIIEAINNEDTQEISEILEKQKVKDQEVIDAKRSMENSFRNRFTCVQKDDFYVGFDDFNIDEKYVTSFTWDGTNKLIYMTVYDYIYEENGKMHKLMKVLCERSRQNIGDIIFQYPMNPEDEKFYVIKFNNCKLDEFYVSGFKKEEQGCHEVNLVISFEESKFSD